MKPQDPIYYFNNLRYTKPRAIITPLVEDVFNECKSNIAYLEATMAGALCYSNQWGEFKGKGLSLSELERRSPELHAIASEDIRENYNLTKLNDRRIELFKSLI